MNPRVAYLQSGILLLFGLFIASFSFPITTYGTGLGSPPANSTASVTQPPVITGFTPASGPVGSEVTISGQNLSDVTAFWFNGMSAEFRGGFQGTNVIATVPPGATSGPLTIFTPAGNFTTKTPFTVTLTQQPQITSISPSSGPVGSQVVIDGDNLASATAVRFSGVEADFTLFGGTVTAVVPAGASSGSVSVVTPGGTATSATPFQVTVAGAPTITDVAPEKGPPGTFVTINGANLETTTGVNFSGVAANFNVFGTALFALVPEGAVTGPITVLNPKGVVQSPNPFVVLSPQSPDINNFLPDAGVPGGIVTVTGTNFVGTTAVRIGGVAAAFTVVSGSVLEVTVPASPLSGPISVVTPIGTAITDNDFYVPAQIASFDPTHGAPGTTVSVRGRNFNGVSEVKFGGTSAPFTYVSPTEIHATVPPGASSGSISVAAPAGFGISDADFYLPPIITRLDPPSGSTPTVVTISGENLSGVTFVRFGTVNATFTPVSINAVAAAVPKGAVSAPVTLATQGGAAVSPQPFYVGDYSDITVSASASPDPVAIDGFLNYTLSVTNSGPLAAPSVILQDILPPRTDLVFQPSGASCSENNGIITCQLGNLAPGADVSIRFSVQVDAGAYLTNLVSVTTSGADPDLSNNSDSLVTTVVGNPPAGGDVSLKVAVSGSSIVVSWPAIADGYVLETTTALTSATTWSPSSAVPVTANGYKTVTEPIGPGKRFYRLHKP